MFHGPIVGVTQAARTDVAPIFTHMVNVSILTMGKARGLEIDGPLLREFGMGAHSADGCRGAISEEH